MQSYNFLSHLKCLNIQKRDFKIEILKLKKFTTTKKGLKQVLNAIKNVPSRDKIIFRLKKLKKRKRNKSNEHA